jgi:hypothetical protein
MEDGEVELVRVLQEGEMAHGRQDEEARVGNGRSDIFGVGALDRLVVVAVDDEDGGIDRLELAARRDRGNLIALIVAVGETAV